MHSISPLPVERIRAPHPPFDSGRRAWLRGLVASALGGLVLPRWAQAAPALALGYEPGYPPGFSHFKYVNPAAPKGGALVLSAAGSFDSLNPFLLKGMAAAGLGMLVFETLLERSLDEPFSAYGLLAEDVELAEDGLSVTFRLNTAALFSDGEPVHAEDVKFSFETLTGSDAHPQYRFYWADVAGVEALDSRHVRFNFARQNPELHLILGEMPVFSRRWLGGGSLAQAAMKPPLASGPYLLERFDIGKSVHYRRNPDYWARDLNTRRGMFNFDRISFKYYKDRTVALEAFKAGEFDFFFENHSKRWARDHVGPRYRSGEIRKTELPHGNNAGMQGFVFNTRRAMFADVRVRRAIALALDFEWSNHNLFYDQYSRCDSYFSNSELAARGLPEDEELALLQPFRDRLPEAVFTQTWRPPQAGTPEKLRANLREARRLLAEAGWTLREGGLVNAQGEALRFEIVLDQKAFERIVAPFVYNLRKLGIEAGYRTIDAALYQRRLDRFDFDMVVDAFGQSQSPGNELMGLFHSSAADSEGARNTPGVRDPVVDALIEKVIYAPDRASKIIAARALDRVLLHGEYLVTNWYSGTYRIAWWDKFGRPDILPLFYAPESWMIATWWSLKS